MVLLLVVHWAFGTFGGQGEGEGDWVRESLADENPPPPSLCKFKQLSCLAQLRAKVSYSILEQRGAMEREAGRGVQTVLCL